MKRLFFRLLFTQFIIVLFSIITLTIWFSINSKDLHSVDLGLFASEPEYLDDDENAYYRMVWSGLSEISDELKSSNAVSFENLLFGDSWNDEYVDKLLHRYQEDLLSLERLPRDLDFQLPHSESVYDLPDYIPIVNLARLSLVKAEYLRRNGDIDSALSTLDASIHFANSIKNEKNNFLISYAIGLILLDESVLQIQFILDDPKISKGQALKIRNILSSLDSFLSDNIFKVMISEFRFARRVIDQLSFEDSFYERVSSYIDNTDPFHSDWMSNSNINREIIRLISIFFPDFYIHRNYSLSLLHNSYSRQVLSVDKFCANQPASGQVYFEISTTDIFTPNALGIQDRNMTNFDEYFQRRCLTYTHLEATIAIAAMTLYRIDNGLYPNSLDILLEGYLKKLPIDYFGGDTLRYSSEHRWLYSIGTSSTQTGGSKDAIFHSKCFSDDCAENPTFPLDSTLYQGVRD